MPRSTIHTLTVSCICALLLTFGGFGGCSLGTMWDSTSQQNFTQTASYDPALPIHILGRNGNVTVTTEDRADIHVEAIIRAAGKDLDHAGQRLAATTLTVGRDTVGVEGPGTIGDFVIHTAFPDRGLRWSGESDSVSYTVVLPSGASGASPKIMIDTSNGTVTATALSGVIDIDTSNGTVTLTDHDGEAAIDTSNGKIIVHNLTGPLLADTSNGSITATLHPDNPGPLNLDTSNGSVTVTVGHTFGGQLTMDTSNGSIRVDDDEAGPLATAKVQITDDEGTITFTPDGADSRIDTSNGNITVNVTGG